MWHKQRFRLNGVYWFCTNLFRLITYEYIKDSTAVLNAYIETLITQFNRTHVAICGV